MNSKSLKVLFIVLPIVATSSNALGEQTDDLKLFGERFVIALNGGGPDELRSLFDMGALANRVLAKSGSSIGRYRDEIITGTKDLGMEKLVWPMIVQLRHGAGRAKYVRGVCSKDERRIVVRIPVGSTFDYKEFVVEKNTSGELHIVDWYHYSVGELTSDVLRYSTGLVYGDRGFWQHALGERPIDAEQIAILAEAGRFNQEGRYSEAIANIRRLPAKIRKNRLILLGSTVVASRLENKSEFRRLLREVHAEYGGDPKLAMLLFGYHVGENDFSKAMECIDSLQQEVGQDAYLEQLRANVRLESGDHRRARSHAASAVRMDPELDGAYSILAQSSAKLGLYRETVDALQRMLKLHGDQLSKYDLALGSIPDFEGFLNSQEYAIWMRD